jgi:hypothetical protein
LEAAALEKWTPSFGNDGDLLFSPPKSNEGGRLRQGALCWELFLYMGCQVIEG